MGYAEELQDYIDPVSGLVGIGNTKSGYSTGNPLLETGTAWVFLAHICGISSQNSLHVVEASETCLKASGGAQNGFYATKPGTTDRISHDDVIGLVSALSMGDSYCHEALEHGVIKYGNEHHWVMSTDGKLYWDAITKPWHKAFYLMAAGIKPGFFNMACFLLFVAADALFNKDNASDKRLTWLMLAVLGDQRSWLLALVARLWYSRLRGSFGSVRAVFEAYHGKDHIFARYCWE